MVVPCVGETKYFPTKELAVTRYHSYWYYRIYTAAVPEFRYCHPTPSVTDSAAFSTFSRSSVLACWPPDGANRTAR
jgi:hypothetical protein